MSSTTTPAAFDNSSVSCSSSEQTTSTLTLRERRGFNLYLSFAPAFPKIEPKGQLGPTHANLPRRRKRSSVVSVEASSSRAAAPAAEITAYFS
ncbi:hypothetical protein MIND_00269500 [Mycena indigotica]|uniref:Uncharacterized protein n=1 Tax=Mycena indigotica TaxID=2126181 RepID=A0A8H6T7X1_9AGAR|nr:uncharacterized protein MIND_00269500 [Mycena indigotica]KAF7312555.1 hypothetical protein MIND_00269500 [Mycena indigotica]